MSRALLLCSSAALLTACSNDDSQQQPPPPDWSFQVALAPCGFVDPAVAHVDVSERVDVFHPAPFARVEAKVKSGPDPKFHHVTMEEGSCRYLELAYGACDPACSAEQFCTLADECELLAVDLDGGALGVKGLGARIDVTSESFSPGTYYMKGALAADIFDDSTEIGARFSAFPELSLGARGVAAMDPQLTETGFEMVDGQDVEMTWTPGPDPDACVQVVLNGSSTAHGVPLQDIIECEGPDAGSLTIPRALVEHYPAGDTPEVTEGFDWPHSRLTRYTRATTDAPPGRMELVVHSTTYFLLSHP